MIVTLPALTPVTVPVLLTVATAVLPLVHVPPPVALLKVVVAPSHTELDNGDIAAGVIVTVTSLVTEQPAPFVYDIRAVPADTPVTRPVPLPTVATVVLLLVHAPPGLASERVTLYPVHMLTGVDGVIAAGFALTVNDAVTKQLPTE